MLNLLVQGNVAEIIGKQVDRVAVGVRAGIDQTTKETQTLLRSQVRAAFGARSTRLSNAWRAKTYPNRPSLRAAGLVYTQAPNIITAFDKGETIRPSRGRKYLAIPTEFNRQTVGRGIRPIITAQQMVASKAAFVFRSRRTGVRLWMLKSDEALSLSSRGSPAGSERMEKRRLARVSRFQRAVRGGGVRGSRSREFRARGIVPLFVLVPAVTPRRRLNVNNARDFAARRVQPAIMAAWRSAR
jgi:hypothetical protein